MGGGDFNVMVRARHDLSMRDRPTLPTPHFLINTQVRLNFHPSDPTLRRSLPLDVTSSSHLFPSSLLTADSGAPGSLSWELIASVVDDAQLHPFAEDTVRWVTNPWVSSATTPTTTLLEDHSALVRYLLHAARSAASSPSNATRKTIPLFISFNEEATLPTQEFEVLEWATKRKEREDRLRSMVCFMAKYAVSGRWSREELESRVEEMVVKSAPVKKEEEEEEEGYEQRLVYCAKRMALFERALILADGLAEVTVDGGIAEDGIDFKELPEQPEEVCPICMERFFYGEVANRMPCSCANLYHRPCILKCLDWSDSCPTCRFVLPLPTR